MNSSMKWLGAAALVLATVTGCGGGSDSSAPPPATTPVGQTIAAAAALPANDTATNSSSAFKVLQGAGVPAVIVNGAPVVNFAVFSDGLAKRDLVLSNVSFAIAKLVPGANGDIDRWVSYVYRTETATAGVGPGGNPVLPTALQATNDPKPAGLSNQLVFNPDGYYTYTFSTNITNPASTSGVVFEPNRTHRIAIQLSYTNRAGEQILVNPYFDVTFDANGRSVPVTDPAKTRVMADTASCNGCHDKLAIHGGGRVDVQYCVMCHNPSTFDANSGNVLTMSTMTHKIHAGRLLKSQFDAGQGGEEYKIWGFRNSLHDYTEVGYPQDLRNCSVCHTAANPNTPQGDLWKTSASKEACATCHSDKPGSSFYVSHTLIAQGLIGPTAVIADIPNRDCAACHRPGTGLAPDRVHWNQTEENAAKYKMNIERTSYDATARAVTVQYSLSDPTNGNAVYNLVTPDCTGAGATLTCSNSTRFGNLRFYVAYANVIGQPDRITEFSAFNNGGSGANAFAYRGANDGSNRYTLTIPIPADTATAIAKGTARVISIGQIKEAKLDVRSATDPRPPIVPTVLVNTVVQHTFADVALSGELNPRRQVVSNEKCNVCHGALGTTSGSNTLANAFHGGARNTVESCALCHDQNRFSSTVMTNGMALSENYSFKRMIHGIHGNSRRTYPFTHGNTVIGEFDIKTGLLLANGFASGTAAAAPLGTLQLPFATVTQVLAGTPFGAGVENYAAEVAYPSVGLTCNGCHVNDSWKRDLGQLGSVVTKPLVGTATPLRAGTDPLDWRVISPKAATCTACHDSKQAIDHVINFGGSSFGTITQGQLFSAPRETCDDCHAPGNFKGVDVAHGQR